MRVYSCPSSHVRFLEATIAIALAEIGRDVDRRSDSYEPVRLLATVPDTLIDATATGRALIVVGVTDENLSAAIDTLNSRTPRNHSPL